MFVYIESESAKETGDWPLFTVGHYSPSGEWCGESDHGGSDGRDNAADRVAWLNGSGKAEPRPRGITANADLLADIIRETLPAKGMRPEWQTGCIAACERIAERIASLMRATMTGEQLAAWYKRAGVSHHE